MTKTSPARSRVLLAIAMMAGGTLIIPLMDAIAKVLVLDGMSGLQVATGRFVSQIILLTLPFVIQRPLRGSASDAPTRTHGIDAMRGIFLALGTVFFFSSLRYMQLPDATAILLLVPIFLLLLARAFLHEAILPLQWVGIVASFLSALLIIRPGNGVLSLSSALPLLAALSFSGYFLLTRRSAQSGSALGNQLLVSVFAALFLGVVLLIVQIFWPSQGIFVMPQTVTTWVLLLLLGAVSLISHTAIFLAMRIGTVGLLAPFIYFEILSASVLSIIMFGQAPDPRTIAGAALLIGINMVNSVYSAKPRL